MKEITLNDGNALPMLGLGTWKSAPDEVYRAVRRAIEVGYTHLDCAAVYGNEAEIGQALEDAFKAGDIARDALWVTSKLWNTRHRPEDVRGALEQTLRDLRLEQLDLYLIHWPVAMKGGATFPFSPSDFLTLEEVPLEATWEAVVATREAGLTRSVGVSNMGPARLSRLSDAVGVTPAVNQVEAHPYLQQRALKDHCDGANIALTAYSPLGSRDRQSKREDELDLFADPVIQEIGAAHGASPAQVLIAWSVQRGVSVVPKSTNPDRIAQNLAAASLTLSDEAMASIASLDRNARYIDGSFWCAEGTGYDFETLWS